LIQDGSAWVLEETIVKMGGEHEMEMRISTKNLNHRRLLDVVELQRIRKVGENITLIDTTGFVKSDFGFKGLRRKIEDFAIRRFSKNVEKVSSGQRVVLLKIYFLISFFLIGTTWYNGSSCSSQ
jgi:hypothetical protein